MHDIMKYAEPVLFPVNVDLLDSFKIIGNNHIKKVDILSNYNYQAIDHLLIMKYIDPDLLTICYDYLQIHKVTELADIIDRINISTLFKHYFLFFVCSYIREAGKFESHIKFNEWLLEKRDYTYRKVTKPKYIHSISSYYNTIIIPKMWRNNSHGNQFNRIHDLSANYFDQIEILKKSVKHLIEGGKIYLLNKRDYSWVLYCLGDNFEEVEPYVFQKKIIPKPKSKTTLKLWL